VVWFGFFFPKTEPQSDRNTNLVLWEGVGGSHPDGAHAGFVLQTLLEAKAGSVLPGTGHELSCALAHRGLALCPHRAGLPHVGFTRAVGLPPDPGPYLNGSAFPKAVAGGF